MKRIKLDKIPRLNEREWWWNGDEGMWRFSEVYLFNRTIRLVKYSHPTMPFRVLYGESYCEYPHTSFLEDGAFKSSLIGI